MDDREVYGVVDFILNRATDKDIQLVTAAIEKRIAGDSNSGKAGSLIDSKNIGKQSRQMAQNINSQLSMTKDQIRKSVREMVVTLIKQKVPDIPDEHLKVLLEEWVGEPGKKKKVQSNIPPDVLMIMIGHFVKYSTNTMPLTEQEKLRSSMPNWQEHYWKNFPPPVQLVISDLLNGTLEPELFWEAINMVLGINNEETT